MYGALIGISVLSFMVICGYLQRRNEKKIWNNGVCSKCGCNWEIFDTDSQGGRGYNCPNGNYTWISYNVDKLEAESG